MNKSLLTGLIVGVAVATAGVAVANFDLLNRNPKYAEVLDVDPVSKSIKTPREECSEQAVTRTKPVKDEHRVAGTVIGAVVGGVLGSQVGSGDGRKVATAAGAAAGGYAGNKVQQGVQNRNTYTTTETQCRTVYDTSEKIVGYDVRYKLRGETSVVRMDHDPGERIPIENGELVLAKTAS